MLKRRQRAIWVMRPEGRPRCAPGWLHAPGVPSRIGFREGSGRAPPA